MFCSLQYSRSYQEIRVKVHVTRIQNYCSLDHGKKVPKDDLFLAERTAGKYEVVEYFMGIDQNDEEIWLCVQWDGLSEKRDFM